MLNGRKATFALDVHRVVGIAVDTGLVREEEIRIAQLSQDIFLIHLPLGLAVDTFVKATPPSLWDEGFVFEHWSQTHNAKVIVSRFKVLLDLVGVPVHIWDEKKIARMVSKFGLFLGTVAPEHATNFMAVRVAVATDDLARIPLTMGMMVGGLEHPVRIRPVTWKKGAIYEAADFPTDPPRLHRPPSPPSPPSSEDFLNFLPATNDDSDLIVCSRRVLFGLCNGLNPSRIPPEIMAVLTGTKKAVELSVYTLKDLLQATDDQKQEDDLMGQAPTQAPPVPSQISPPTELGAHESTQPNHNQSATSMPTRISRNPDSPAKDRLSREAKNKGIDVFGGAGETSVQGTVAQVPNEGKEVLFPSPGIDCGDNGDSQGEIHYFKASMAAVGSHPIQQRRRHSQANPNHVNRSFHVQTFHTSRHIRFKDMVGRGRGRAHFQGPSNVNLNEVGQYGRGTRPNCWVRSAKPIQRINPTLLPQPVIAAQPEGPIQQPLRPQGQDPCSEDGLGSTSATAQKGAKRKPVSSTTEDRPKRPLQNKTPPQAVIDLNPEGHFQVSIQQAHGEQIAKACGISVDAVFQELREDNAKRVLRETASQADNNEPTEEEMRQSEARFQVDTEEDSDSGEAC